MKESFENDQTEVSPEQLRDLEQEAANREADLRKQALWAESMNNDPSELSPEVLEKLEERLAGSIGMYKGMIKSSFKYSIPLAPLIQAINEKDERAMNVVLGASGMNMPVGIGMVIAETIELVSKYRKILSVRKEMRARESVSAAMQ